MLLFLQLVFTLYYPQNWLLPSHIPRSSQFLNNIKLDLGIPSCPSTLSFPHSSLEMNTPLCHYWGELIVSLPRINPSPSWVHTGHLASIRLLVSEILRCKPKTHGDNFSLLNLTHCLLPVQVPLLQSRFRRVKESANQMLQGNQTLGPGLGLSCTWVAWCPSS